jgi:hypothetical protein
MFCEENKLRNSSLCNFSIWLLYVPLTKLT